MFPGGHAAQFGALAEPLDSLGGILFHAQALFVTVSQPEASASAALIGKFKSLIEANGTIDSVDDWGKRRLAYPIEDETEGVYTVIKFTSEPDFPAELDRNYRITEGVLRSIIVAEEA